MITATEITDFIDQHSRNLLIPRDGHATLRLDIRVAYTGSQNGSAAAPAGNNYRLKICGISVVK